MLKEVSALNSTEQCRLSSRKWNDSIILKDTVGL